MTWSVVLDPAAVASGAPAYRQPLDLNNGAIRVDQKGLDWGDSQVQTYLADRRVGSIKIDFRMPNRKVTIPLFLMDDDTPGGTGVTEEDARALLQEKVGLIQMRGGWLMRQREGGVPTYTDVVDAVLTMPDVWGETGGVEPNINLILECSPDFYGDEISLDLATVTGGQLTGALQQGGAPADIEGDHLGRAEILVTDTSGSDQLALIWAFRSTFYDPASTAQLVYEAEALGVVSPSTVTTVGGRTVVRNPSLTTGWSPIVNTNIGGTTPMTHLGSYRVRARVYTLAGVPVWVRLIWGVGASIGVITNSLVPIPSTPGNFYIVDLGEIRIDWPPVGLARWEGQIQAMGALNGLDVSIDQIYLQPLDDSAGYVIANPSVTILSSPVAADSFASESTGDLTGQTAPVGGSWSEPITGVGTPSGPLPSGALANHSGAGTQAWSTPSTSVATITSFATSTTSQYLQTSGHGITVPSTATITGIEVDIQRAASGGPVFDGSSTKGGFAGVVLQNAGTVLSSDKSNTTAFPSTGTAIVSYGGPGDLWGATLTPAIVNASTFGIFYAATTVTGGSASNVAVSNFNMTVYYTVSGSLNFQVDPTNDWASRTLPDGNNHVALLGTSIAATDVSANMGLASYPTTANAGIVARYIDPNNFLGAYLWATISGGAPFCQLYLLLRVGGTPTNLFAATPAFPATLPTMFSMRLVVSPAGQAQVYLNGVVIGTATDARLATGGALATGRTGLLHMAHISTVQTLWDNFVVYDSASTDAVVFGGSSAALRFDGMYRADPSQTYYGPIAQVVGDLPRLPPSGLEGRPVELFLLATRGDLQNKPDLALGSFTAQVTYRPVRIHRA